MAKPCVLIGGEFTATLRNEFAREGWFAMSCDFKPSEVGGRHTAQGEQNPAIVKCA